ncbi:MAG: type II secretion system protein [Planctomycetia bacterium]|nr:type II secretion system protein [Planctomycetia bacterium]
MKNRTDFKTGFTLIELITVILIIGLLSVLSVGAYIGAKRMFAGLTVKQELDNIARALEQYKTTYGEYPPDAWASDQEVQRHILRRWPDVLKSGAVPAYLTYYTANIASKPESVLLFWLCGPYRPSEDARNGFSLNKSDPFDLAAANNASGNYEPPMLPLTYDLKADERHHGNCNQEALIYKDVPIVYFKATANKLGLGAYADLKADAAGVKIKSRNAGTYGIAVPYAMYKNGTVFSWYNTDGYQLITAGEDNNFGKTDLPRNLSDPSTYSLEDSDNVTNFCEGTTLQTEYSKYESKNK